MTTKDLTPFKKGDPRAIAGGKKSKRGVSIKSALKRMFAEGRVSQDEFVDNLAEQAKQGNGAIAKLIVECIDGKVTDKLEITGAGGKDFIPPKIVVQGVKPDK